MKTEALQGLLPKIVLAVASAGTVGAGGTLIKTATDNAVQEQRITAVEASLSEVKELNDNLQETKTEVALLRKELEVDRESR